MFNFLHNKKKQTIPVLPSWSLVALMWPLNLWAIASAAFNISQGVSGKRDCPSIYSSSRIVPKIFGCELMCVGVYRPVFWGDRPAAALRWSDGRRADGGTGHHPHPAARHRQGLPAGSLGAEVSKACLSLSDKSLPTSCHTGACICLWSTYSSSSCWWLHRLNNV